MNGIQHLAENWKKEVRYSDSVTRAVWRELSRYAGTDAADRAFQLWHGEQRHATQFRDAIELGDSYFLAFEDADENVDGDILYYGAMWLGYALTYLCLGHGDIENAGTGHGVDATIDIQKKNPFLSIEINIGKANEMLSMVNKALGGDQITGRHFVVRDFLQAIPELDSFLVDITGSGTTAYRGEVSSGMHLEEPYTNPSHQFMVRLPEELALSDGFLRDNLVAYEYLKSRGLAIDPANNLAWTRQRSLADELTAVCVETPGGVFYFAPTIHKLRIAELTGFLAVLFAISRIVRYYPQLWLKIIRDQTDEHFLIRQFIDLAERKIPNLVINYLSKKAFSFTST